MANRIAWHCHDFDGFTPLALYQALQLRDRVFVVEQRSIYGDVDGVDTHCLHLSGRDDGGRLLAYARLIAPETNTRTPPPSAGWWWRGSARPGPGQGADGAGGGQCQIHFPGKPVMLSAQVDAVALYQSLGFKPVSAPYDDGGIPHVDMRRE
ncbi:putative acyltransferase [Chromobacterium violaceum]|uniref:Putative acyltransferase n=1 Tax=Chromobacterium violaceum TaxID=536 RepID=A0A447T470_CHRVL|nr:putative acyltransferase [Chromobacterium violaceum]